MVEVCKTTASFLFDLFHSSFTGISFPSTFKTFNSGGMEVTVTVFLAISPLLFTLKDSPALMSSVEPVEPVIVAEPFLTSTVCAPELPAVVFAAILVPPAAEIFEPSFNVS